MIERIKKTFEKIKNKFTKKEEIINNTQKKVVIIEIYKNASLIKYFKSSDKNQVKNYSELIKYLSHYEFETIHDLERNCVEIYIVPKKNDILESA